MVNSLEEAKITAYNGVIRVSFQDPRVTSIPDRVILDRCGELGELARKLAEKYTLYNIPGLSPLSYFIGGVVITPEQIRWSRTDKTSLEGCDFSRADGLRLVGSSRDSLEAVAAFLGLPGIPDRAFLPINA